ncbi:MAG TPA: hypothetical protein VLX92_24240 [Kofleriaceae bacterium]|nr:hypothetical protein [Kofleriaceae bacterium]
MSELRERQVPAAVWLWFACGIAAIAMQELWVFARGSGVAYELALAGFYTASDVLAAFGIAELAARATGGPRIGLTIAWSCFAASAALGALEAVVFALWQPHSDLVFAITSYLWWALGLAMAVSLFIGNRARGIAVVFLVFAIVTEPPPIVQALIRDDKLDVLLPAIHMAMLFVLAHGAACGPIAVEPARAAAGLRRIAGGLKLRVVAAVVLTGLTLLVIAMQSESGEDVLKLALVSAAAINCAAQLAVALGALGAARRAPLALSRWSLALGAAATLFALGVMWRQLIAIYQITYRDGSLDSWDLEHAHAAVESLPVVIGLVGVAGVTAAGNAILQFASRTGQSQLVEQATARMVAFVILMLVSIGAQVYALPRAESVTGAIAVTLIAAVCGLVAMVMMARLFAVAAEAVDGPSLPSAKIV